MKRPVATTSAEIVEIQGERTPFKVVFSKGGQVIAQHSVVSREGARRLITDLLPLLQKYDDN
jgi:hypothetical protein